MAQDLCALLREKKLISIVRGAPTEKITKIADAIYRGGFRFMEITFDQSGKTPHAVTAEQIRIVREAFDGRLHVGAGTVMTEAQLKLAAEAGAEYIISPNVDTAIIRATKAAGLISIPGAFTPSEIAGAYQAGADFVKLFPVDCVDLKYIKAVRAPINHIPLLAVSGVTPENLGDYLKAGMAGAGIGSILVKGEDVAADNFEAIAAARRALCRCGRKHLIPSQGHKNPAGVCSTSRVILCPRIPERDARAFLLAVTPSWPRCCGARRACRA